jgi:hypothetical protein
MGEMIKHTQFWSESLNGKSHLEKLEVDGRIISN